MNDRVIIFDTTLRDGEQSPGISLNPGEKLEIAHQLARLGVDVIEAGFPAASPGDFEAVRTIAREVHGPVIAGLARAHASDIDRAADAVREAERPRIHTFISTSDIHIEHQLQSTREDVKGSARASVAHARSLIDDVEFSPMDATRADVEFTAEVIQIAIDEGATTINIPDTVGYAMPDEYARFLGRLYELVPALRDVVLSVHCHDDLGLAVANSLRRRAGRRAPGRVRDQRHRRAGRQRVARGDRDAARDAQGGRRLPHRHHHARDRAHQPHDLPAHRLPRAAQQGDRRAQRVRARVRHPPGRRAQGALDLRDHGRDHDRAGGELARARQALRPPRAARGAAGARLHRRRPGAQHRVQALQGDRGQEEAGQRDGPRGAGHRRAPRRAARLHARSGSTSRHRAAARRTRPSSSRRPTATPSAATSPATARSTRSSARSTPPPRREARLREFRIDSVTGGPDALGEASVVLEVAGQSAGGQGVSTDIIEAAALAYVRALSNAERRVAAAADSANALRASLRVRIAVRHAHSRPARRRSTATTSFRSMASPDKPANGKWTASGTLVSRSETKNRALWTMKNGYALCTEPGLVAITRWSKHLRRRSKVRFAICRAWAFTRTCRSPLPATLISLYRRCFAPPSPSRLPNSGRALDYFRLAGAGGRGQATLWAGVLNAHRSSSNVIFLTELGGAPLAMRRRGFTAMRRVFLLL